ncbi:A24 family peptidase [Marinimicrobium sp. C2-29]|uniref:A24 family peptidase n=1 Tax=Marinimicrobium sp. C2-29 TaxID=3139825 RepID=UPI00313A08A6
MLAWHTHDFSTLLLLAVLLAACWTDVRRHRIPNRLVLAAIMGGLGLHTWFLGWQGMAASLGGVLLGGLILLPFYIVKVHGLRLMSAGDVKLMAAVGAFLGPLNSLLAVGLTLAMGSLAALGYLLCKGGLGAYLQRTWLTLKTLLLTGQWLYQPPEPNEVALHRFPYALAIAAGTSLTLAHLSLLQFDHLRTLLNGVWS